MSRADPPASSLRRRVHDIVFEAETPAGKAFDAVLLLAILASVLAVVLESVRPIRAEYGAALRTAEWVFTGLFSVEYVLRLWCVPRPMRYARSFFGIVDLLAVVPSYLSLVVAGAQSLLVVRVVRLLRIFRVFKMVRYVGEANVIMQALVASARKIAVFVGGVLSLVVVLGALMHLIEGGDGGFDSIPSSMYWAVVTLTTVGFGDIVPQTTPGRILAAVVMMLGYGMIAVPTGIVTVELGLAGRTAASRVRRCAGCGHLGHDPDAAFCKRCGVGLPG